MTEVINGLEKKIFVLKSIKDVKNDFKCLKISFEEFKRSIINQVSNIHEGFVK